MYESHLRKSYPTLLNGFILELMAFGERGRHFPFFLHMQYLYFTALEYLVIQ